jgi:hypothetical protein
MWNATQLLELTMLDIKEQVQNEKDAQKPPVGLRSSHYILIQILLSLICLVLIFGGAELVARVRQYHRFGPKSLQPLALRDAFTGYRLNPAYGRVDRQHNAQGFRRDKNVSLEKPGYTTRIFIIGGSTAYGYSTNMPEDTDNQWRFLYNNQTIDYYLEQKLEQAFPSKRWEVINAAAPAYQLSQELAEIESVLLRYRPDYVILLDGYNDIDALWKHATENYDPYASIEDLEQFNLLANPHSFKSLAFFGAQWLRSNSAGFRLLEDHLWSLKRKPDTGGHQRKHVNNPVNFYDLTPKAQANFTTAQSQLGFYTHTVRQIRSILDMDGVKPIFLLQPVMFLTHKQLTGSEQRILDDELTFDGLAYCFQQLFPQIDASMTATARQDGFVFLNLTDVFDKTPAQTFSDDVHLTPEGNRMIAERLFELLKGIDKPNSITKPQESESRPPSSRLDL